MPHQRHRQRGAALLLAMLVVALVASLAAAATWQQYHSVQAETDERAQVQARWLIAGALDWSKIILHLDARAGNTDHLNEPWSVPLEEAKLGTFLNAENNVAQNANTDLADAFFSGGMQDLNGRLNVTNLVKNNTVDTATLEIFEHLFASLGLAPELAKDMAQKYLESTRSALDADVALSPTCTQELTWLGLSTQQIHLLEPYITVLPQRTRINLNTASERVLAAVLPGNETQTAAARLAAVRNLTPFTSVADASALLEGDALSSELFSVASDFFLVNGKLRLEGLEVLDRYVLRRDGQRIRTVRRECTDPGWRMQHMQLPS
ncbi:general secretion pathway protein GspK [Lampropedia puyangensis]|uniref:Type II secretion system protein K n=2 Tax=Lampropedia puyangensis TaxID=1330072 RepID=A0A4S8FDG7_9BURK|nr:general secretion pathway protein GspK [Lampropedia puyangensis]